MKKAAKKAAPKKAEAALATGIAEDPVFARLEQTSRPSVLTHSDQWSDLLLAEARAQRILLQDIRRALLEGK